MSTNTQNSPESLRITAEDVIGRMNRGEDLYFVDTRNPQAWADADTKLPGAVRVPADAVTQHFADMPRDRIIVAYCT